MCGIVGVISGSGQPGSRSTSATGAHFLQHQWDRLTQACVVFDEVHRTVISLEKGEGLADDIFKTMGVVKAAMSVSPTPATRPLAAGGTRQRAAFSTIAFRGNGTRPQWPHHQCARQIDADLAGPRLRPCPHETVTPRPCCGS